jgi:VanZ family protein
MGSIPGMDKLLHFTAYTVLAAAAGLWFSRESWIRRPWRNFLISTAVASLYGVLDEFHQFFVPARDCSVWDWVADTLGGVTGAAAILLAARFWEGRLQKKYTK